jgi:hypothetical protein
MLKIVAILLLLVALAEGWVIYKLQEVGQQIYLPSHYFSEIDSNIADDFFTAKGSWISDTKLVNAAQTTELHCYKDFGYCIDSTAQISDGKTLDLFNDLYEIESWTKAAITTKPTKSAVGCVEYILKIDRVRKKVTSLRTTIDKSELCNMLQDAPIASYLGDGIDRQNKIKEQK